MTNPKTVIVGIGGMGGNAINNLISGHNLDNAFLYIGTNANALEHSLAQNKLLIGEALLHGAGAGGSASLGKTAAEESLQKITPFIAKADTVYLISGLGGGTGSGAAPVIAKHALDLGKKIVCVVSTPFDFEGTQRGIVAREALAELNKIGVQKRVFHNQDLFKTANEKTTFAEAFAMADNAICELIGAAYSTD